MRILLTGAGGMLARALVPVLRDAGHELLPLYRTALDVTDGGAIRRELERYRPEVVIQCAAYTAVDRAEEEEGLAREINADSTRRFAEWCQKSGATLVYPSTDYVLSGTGERPYRPQDPTEPVNAYGRTKLAGEEAAREADRALIVRTSWLYGAGGPNFVETILRLAAERDELQVVDDQIGRPTWTVSLSHTMSELLGRGHVGTFHATDGGAPVSWYGFARAVLEQAGMNTTVRPVSTGGFPRPARRPSYSVLDCAETERAIGRPLPEWRSSLAAHIRSRGS